jgi:regulator of cell morphogenesis and NO signaling
MRIKEASMSSMPSAPEHGIPDPVNLDTPVRDFVLAMPAAARVFEAFGIDYCCGGSQTLSQACRAANRPVEELSAALRNLDSLPSDKDWRNAPLAELAQHIVDRHHSFTRAELARITSLIAKVVSVHSANHPELARLQSIFAGLSEELTMHMIKEEKVLFPYVAEMEEAARVKRRPPAPMFGTVQNPVAAMMMEHEATGQAFDKMREITGDYAVPPDGCASYQALYQALPAFAIDVHQHIHLENNILFPRSVELESIFG